MAALAEPNNTNPTPQIPQITDRPTFANPISRATFEALPKIYGRTKRKKYLPPHPSDQNQDPDPSTGNQTIRMSLIQRYYLNQTPAHKESSHRDNTSQKRFKTQMKSFDKRNVLQHSQPKKHSCSKRHCYCCIDCTSEQHKSTQKMAGKIHPNRQLRLPEIERNADLDDKQSRHKVSSATYHPHKKQVATSRKPFSLLDLIKSSERKYKPIFEQNYQSETPINGSGRRTQRKEVEIQFPLRMECAGVQTERQMESGTEDNLKGKTEPVDKMYSRKEARKVDSSNSNLSHQPQHKPNTTRSQDLQDGTEGSKEKLQLQQLRAKQTEHAVIDSQSQDSRSVKSSLSSASLSKHIFESSKQSNTMFHSLKSRQTSSVKERNANRQIKPKSNQKFVYQKKNGLFVIPEEDQYVSFVKNYEPMNERFSIKNLVRKPHFKVVKEQEGVYFGQFKDETKDGKGILVTERTIFEGHYTNNVKNYGCQRNIDGVYKGQFVNGVREGYGTFEWNNGEIFEGEWKNGTKNGYGVWKSPRGDYYEGTWKLNRQHGKGIYKHKISTYRGYFLQFLKEGEGEQFFVNGDKYIGSYSKGKPHGFGKYTWADGSYYQGQFQSGLRQGRGKWVYKNGTVYEGEFKNDFKEGYGKQLYKSGQYFEGLFIKGARQEGSLFDSRGHEIKITQSD